MGLIIRASWIRTDFAWIYAGVGFKSYMTYEIDGCLFSPGEGD